MARPPRARALDGPERLPAARQGHGTGQRRDQRHHAVHDGDLEPGRRAETGGAEDPGGGTLARAPAGDVQRDGRRERARTSASGTSSCSGAVDARRRARRPRRRARARRPRGRRARRPAATRRARPGPCGAPHQNDDRDHGDGDRPAPRRPGPQLARQERQREHDQRHLHDLAGGPVPDDRPQAAPHGAGVAAVPDAAVHVADDAAGQRGVEELRRGSRRGTPSAAAPATSSRAGQQAPAPGAAPGRARGDDERDEQRAGVGVAQARRRTARRRAGAQSTPRIATPAAGGPSAQNVVR